MSDSFLTTTDITRFNDSNLDLGIVSNVLNAAPELQFLAARSVPGYTYKYLRTTSAPTVGFRTANDGRENSKTTRETVTVTCGILDASYALDIAVANSDERGYAAALADEGNSHLRSAMYNFGQQIWYGTTTDANGFAGLAEQTNLDDSDDAQVVNAGGTTESTGSSVWVLRTGYQDAHVVWGGGGVIDLGDITTQRVSGDTGTYPAYYVPVTAWAGLQLGSTYSAVRIANLTADSSKTLTDDLIAQAIEKFAIGREPNLIVMNRRSWRQLQDSRTATNPTGQPAPFPQDAFGIKIVVTDTISNTETLLTAAST